MKTTMEIKTIADQVWERCLSRIPYVQLKAGVEISRIPAGTREQAQEDASFAQSILRKLQKMDPGNLPHQDQLTLGFLQHQMEIMSQSELTWLTDFPVTPYTCFWLSYYPQEIFATFRFKDQADIDRYLQLLVDLSSAVQEMHNRLRVQAERGWLLPRPALPGILTTLKQIQDSLPRVLRIAPERVRQLDSELSRKLNQGIEGILTQRLKTSFNMLLEFLGNTNEEKAPDEVGIGQYPGGEEAYLNFLKYRVTKEIDPERVHSIGLEQVAQLTDQMREVRESLGFKDGEQAFHEQLRSSGQIYAKTSQEVEDTYRSHIRRLEPLLDKYFSQLPETPYDVKRLNPELEASLSYGYYEPPTKDRPAGYYRYNGSGLEIRSQLQAATLIYHELVPGHHFQLAAQFENESLHPVRKNEVLELDGFIEGWAEYAADLPKEMGLYDDPYDLYGRLVHERFIAQRLVIDTGMGLLGWSLERGREYMRANTMESETQIATETLRFSTDMPAQSLSYRLGFLEMKRLREMAEKQLGARFDIRAFHQAVLGSGAMPLTLLEEHIKHFIEESQRTE
jgi:uncharacterized protein (DUF885 family)